MEYKNIIEAKFISRLNRFIAEIEIDSQIHLAHVKNTGRCKELFIKGTTVYVEKSDNPNRKTQWSIITIEKSNRLINIDSQVPNHVVKDALLNNQIILPNFNSTDFTIKSEQTYKNSRFDLYVESKFDKGYIEVKGVTLEKDDICIFPDAPTSRGTKHVLELIDAHKNGFKTYIVFLIQMSNIKHFAPNYETDIVFANALKLANISGVHILAYESIVSENTINISNQVKVDI